MTDNFLAADDSSVPDISNDSTVTDKRTAVVAICDKHINKRPENKTINNSICLLKMITWVSYQRILESIYKLYTAINMLNRLINIQQSEPLLSLLARQTTLEWCSNRYTIVTDKCGYRYRCDGKCYAIVTLFRTFVEFWCYRYTVTDNYSRRRDGQHEIADNTKMTYSSLWNGFKNLNVNDRYTVCCNW